MVSRQWQRFYMIKPSLCPLCQPLAPSIFVKVQNPMIVFPCWMVLLFADPRGSWGLALSRALAGPGGCPTALEEQCCKTQGQHCNIFVQGELSGRGTYEWTYPNICPDCCGPEELREREFLLLSVSCAGSFPSQHVPGLAEGCWKKICLWIHLYESPFPSTSLLILFCLRIVSGNGQTFVVDKLIADLPFHLAAVLHRLLLF